MEGGSGGWGSTLVLGTMPITVSVIVLVKTLKARGELKRAHLPTNFGGRFSLKAAIPSSRSWVGMFCKDTVDISLGKTGPENNKAIA